LKNLMKPGLWITVILGMTVIFSCAPAVPSPPAILSTPEASSTPAPLLSMKVATYNVLFGAGLDRQWDEHLPENMHGIDRTPQLIEYLEQLDADIVGLQEVNSWDLGNPPFIKILADRLGMNYFISTGRPDAALITRYEILEAEDLSDEFNSIVRARLRGPDGDPVNVFVVHLDSSGPNNRSCGTQLLLQMMQPYLNQHTLLLGDLNFQVDSSEWSYAALKEQGWRLVVSGSRLHIDHIWASPSMQWDLSEWLVDTPRELGKISDHFPVGKEIRIYSPSGDLAPAFTPTSMPPALDLPPAVAEITGAAVITYREQVGIPCIAQSWNAGWINESYVNGQLRLFGKGDWRTIARWSAPVPAGGGVLLDFKYSPDAEFGLYLDHGTWAEPDYRRIGMYFGYEIFQSDVWDVDTQLGGAWDTTVPARPDTWYRLLLKADENAHLSVFLWAVDDPSQVSVYQRQMDGDWADLEWQLATEANQGRVYVQGVTQLIFDAPQ
jgi:endonuclease/exonuclease/phosphatase family metal-dependent hydrolase